MSKCCECYSRVFEEGSFCLMMNKRCEGIATHDKEEKSIKHQEMIRQVREIGESLIKNAESIVGDEEYLCSLHISFEVNPRDEAPMITIERSFYPEKFVERTNV